MFDLLKHRTAVFWTGLIILLLCIFAYVIGIFSYVDKKFIHYFFKFRQPTTSSQISNIAIIEIDKENLQQDQLWPWGKNWYPYFINLLASYNPKAVLLLLPSHFRYSYKENKLLNRIDLSKFITVYNGAEKELISEQSTFCKVRLIYKKDGQNIISPLVKLIGSYYNERDKFHITKNYIQIKGLDSPFLNIPLNEGSLIVNLVQNSRIPHYNYFDIVVRAQRLNMSNSSKLEKIFKNKVIIFSDKEKIHPTALGKMSKAEILASMVYTIGNRKFIRTGFIFSLPFIFFSGILLFILLTKFNFIGRTFTWGISVISLLGVCYYLFTFLGVLITPFTPLLLVTLLYIDINIYRFIQYRNKKKKQKSEEFAYEIKKRFLPSYIPKLEGIDLQVGTVASRKVGGDFYNFIKLSSNRMVIFIGEVSGVGLEGAWQIEKVNTKLQLIYNENMKLESFYKQLNQDLCMEGKPEDFVKLLTVEVEISEGLVRFLNAGGIPPLVIYPRSGHIRGIKSEDPAPLGIYRRRYFEKQVFRLHIGDVLMLLSEGMYEATQKVPYGIDLEKIFASQNKSISSLVGRVITESKKIYGQDFNLKDRTLIVMRRQ